MPDMTSINDSYDNAMASIFDAMSVVQQKHSEHYIMGSDLFQRLYIFGLPFERPFAEIG